MSILLNENTRVLVQGATGWQAQRHVPFMVAYGTNVLAGVSPGKSGARVAGRPVFDSVEDAVDSVGGFDASVLFVAGVDAAEAVYEALAGGVKLLIVLAEGVPFRDSVEFIAEAAAQGATVIGPNSQGIITPGRAKVGGTGGDRPDRIFMPGRVGVVSRSGGMGAETCWQLTRRGIGQSTYVAIGGELICGAGFAIVAKWFEDDPATDVIVCFGEPGTDQEEQLAAAISSGSIRKPVIAYVPGTFIESKGQGRSYGHAGAVISERSGAPSRKRELLREAGAYVVDDWSEVSTLVDEQLSISAPEGGSQNYATLS